MFVNRIGEILIYALAFAFILTGSRIYAAAPAGEPAATDHPVQKQNSSLFRSVDAVEYKIKRLPGPVLIDVRKKEDFDRIRISGSIHMPLYSIKAKPYLKTKEVILIHAGYAASQFTKECESLRTAGFNISILEGGLNAWRQKGNPFEGDVFAVKNLNKVSASDVYLEKDVKDQVIVDASKTKNPESAKLFPNSIRMSSTEALIKRCLQEKKRILVFNEDGEGYGRIERALTKAGVKDVFFLSGGLNGYSRYVNDLALSWKPKEERIKTINKCDSCGQGMMMKE